MLPLNSKETNTNLVLMFMLWPALVLFDSIRNYRASWAKNGLWLFIIFFGFTFISQEGTDSSRYILRLQEFHSSDSDISVFFDMLYSEGSNYVDIFQPLATLIIAKFTGDYRFLFAFFALVFGYFYTRNIWYLLEKTEGKLDIFLKVIIMIFTLIVPFWYINGVRFWTAAHIFLFGAMPFLMEGKTKRIWVSALSVLVHFSFLLPVLILLVYRMMGNKTTVFFVFFIISFFIAEINIPFIRDSLILYTPEVFHGRITGYASEDRIELLEDQSAHLNWYVVWYQKALNFSINILLLIIFFKGREVWVKRKEMLSLFSFLLLFNGIANILSQVPSVGRFLTVGNLFSVAFLFLYFYYNKEEHLTKKIFLFLTPALGLFFIIALRTGFDSIGVFAFITNPLIAPFLTSEQALIDLIK